MAEPNAKKKKCPNQSNMCGLTHKDIKWCKIHEPASIWRKFSRFKILCTYIYHISYMDI